MTAQPELYPEGNLATYQQKVEEINQEILTIESGLEMSDQVVAMLASQGWQSLTDRLRTVAENSYAILRSKETTPYRQGWHQGRLDILDSILAVRRMTQSEVDDALQRISILKQTLAEYQEVLR